MFSGSIQKPFSHLYPDLFFSCHKIIFADTFFMHFTEQNGEQETTAHFCEPHGLQQKITSQTTTCLIHECLMSASMFFNSWLAGLFSRQIKRKNIHVYRRNNENLLNNLVRTVSFFSGWSRGFHYSPCLI